jgi:hypothetical protein
MRHLLRRAAGGGRLAVRCPNVPGEVATSPRCADPPACAEVLRRQLSRTQTVQVTVPHTRGVVAQRGSVGEPNRSTLVPWARKGRSVEDDIDLPSSA